MLLGALHTGYQNPGEGEAMGAVVTCVVCGVVIVLGVVTAQEYGRTAQAAAPGEPTDGG